jgi:hypothetical protein
MVTRTRFNVTSTLPVL